jgi:Transglutaminase-like superfamily
MTLPFPPVWVPFRLNLWIAARLMPVFAKRRELGAILGDATPEQQHEGSLQLGPAAIVEQVKSVVSKPWRMKGRRCLREGLLAFYYLKLAGKQPLLRFGLLKGTLATSRPRAHCWIVLDGEIILNPPEGLMVHLFDYDGKKSIPASGANNWSAQQ